MDSIADAVRGVDAAVILTEWSAFRSIAWPQLATTMRRPLLIDLRNICEPKDIVNQGMEYIPIGRPSLEPLFKIAAE
jgi:UDPglucose 6-dehydrogenase